MLVFQSKLLLLNCAQRNYQATGEQKHLKQVERFRSGLHHAEAALRDSELHTLQTAGYWVSIYGSLIERATDAVRKLGKLSATLPTAERFEVSTDVQMLDELIAHWTARRGTIEAGSKRRRARSRRELR